MWGNGQAIQLPILPSLAPFQTPSAILPSDSVVTDQVEVSCIKTCFIHCVHVLVKPLR
ncbi:hypothetical protein DESC_580035 [Desulfosarcina cetonica]|nr:hypothetical protein DESC_580035 [Desulfosarcina cetonica]